MSLLRLAFCITNMSYRLSTVTKVRCAVPTSRGGVCSIYFNNWGGHTLCRKHSLCREGTRWEPDCCEFSVYSHNQVSRTLCRKHSLCLEGTRWEPNCCEFCVYLLGQARLEINTHQVLQPFREHLRKWVSGFTKSYRGEVVQDPAL